MLLARFLSQVSYSIYKSIRGAAEKTKVYLEQASTASVPRAMMRRRSSSSIGPSQALLQTECDEEGPLRIHYNCCTAALTLRARVQHDDADHEDFEFMNKSGDLSDKMNMGHRHVERPS